MAQETRNGGTSTFNNNNNGVDNSKKKVLIVFDIFCLLLGKFLSGCWHETVLCLLRRDMTLNCPSTLISLENTRVFWRLVKKVLLGRKSRLLSATTRQLNLLHHPISQLRHYTHTPAGITRTPAHSLFILIESTFLRFWNWCTLKVG